MRAPVGKAVTIAVAVVLALVGLTACGNKAGDVPDKLRTTPTTQFKIVKDGDKVYVIGHQVVMQIPTDWVTYEPEKKGKDGTTWEWSVGLPADTRPLPSGMQFSMGVPKKGVQFDTLPKGTKLLASVSPGYKFLKEGKLDVPGAKHASYLRFERDLQLTDSEKVHVEQVDVFLEVADGVTSTLRFIATPEDWDKQMKLPYDSLKVAPA